MLNRKALAVPVVAALVFGSAGCASWGKTERGAVIGAGAGAAVGAAVGKATGSTARGAIIGAAVGGTAGAIIGRQMDKQAEELAAEIEGARVERIGEGIAVIFDNAILFDYDRADLQQMGRVNLRNLGQSLHKYPNTDVMIVGHADATGSEDYNQRLSERRARSAADYLATQGIPRDRIQAVGRGELEPVADNASADGRSQNRRVEVAIFASEEYRQQLLRQNQR